MLPQRDVHGVPLSPPSNPQNKVQSGQPHGDRDQVQRHLPASPPGGCRPGPARDGALVCGEAGSGGDPGGSPLLCCHILAAFLQGA